MKYAALFITVTALAIVPETRDLIGAGFRGSVSGFCVAWPEEL